MLLAGLSPAKSNKSKRLFQHRIHFHYACPVMLGGQLDLRPLLRFHHPFHFDTVAGFIAFIGVDRFLGASFEFTQFFALFA